MEDFFKKEFLLSLGFKVTEDNGQYGKAESIRPKGKILLSWNREGTNINYFGDPMPGGKNSFFGVEEDGGTRTGFNGIVYSEDDVKFIVDRVI